MLRFNRNYFILTVLLFIIEVLIALYVHDQLIRPYVGDVLVVILIYCFAKTFTTLSTNKAALYTLLFSFFIETLQYFNAVELLGLSHNKLARTVIGTSFSWIDLATYVIGIMIVLFAEKVMALKTKK